MSGNVSQAMAALRLSRRTIYDYVKRGVLRAERNEYGLMVYWDETFQRPERRDKK